jgi:hypothetical protein
VNPFARRRRGRPGSDQPDAVFGYLTAAQGARLRSLVHEAFAERGIEVTIHPDRVEASGGGQYGLTNLAAHCNASGVREWPAIVRWHVDTVLRAVSAPSTAELDDDTVLKNVFVRVMGTSTFPDLSPFGYRRELGGDLVELLALDSEHSVTLLLDSDVERFGAARLRHAGLENLLAEPFGGCEQVIAERGGQFTRLVGDSVYTASRLLTLDDVLRRTTGDTHAPDGVLACVPNRHQLAFHVPSDAEVIPVMEAMARFAAQGYTDGIGPVSPFLYWARGPVLTQLSYPDDGGGLRIEIDEELAAVLERLTSNPRPDPAD